MRMNMAEFIMLVGVPGSGKSTLATYLIEQTEGVWLSSDKIRGELFGDEGIQGDPTKVFDLMQSRTLDALRENKTVIYDATNINRKKRMALLRTLPKYVPTRCIICWAKPETCYNRDATRSRTVGIDIIDRMIMNFQTPHETEGWDKVQLVRTDSTFDLVNDFYTPLSSILHENPHHVGTIQEHINRVTELVKTQFEGANYDKMLLLAQVHDIGKLTTKTFINAKGERTEIAHYYNHQNVGAYYALGLSTQNPLEISWLVNMHMEPFFQETRYFKNLPDDWKNFIKTFNEFDKKGA